MGMTMIENILARHSGRPQVRPGDIAAASCRGGKRPSPAEQTMPVGLSLVEERQLRGGARVNFAKLT